MLPRAPLVFCLLCFLLCCTLIRAQTADYTSRLVDAGTRQAGCEHVSCRTLKWTDSSRDPAVNEEKRGRQSREDEMMTGTISQMASSTDLDDDRQPTETVSGSGTDDDDDRPAIAESTSIILITSLTIETLAPSNAVLPTSQTFTPLATITANTPLVNAAASHRHQIPFFWSWLLRR